MRLFFVSIGESRSQVVRLGGREGGDRAGVVGREDRSWRCLARGKVLHALEEV